MGNIQRRTDDALFPLHLSRYNGGIPDLAVFPRMVAQLHKNGFSPDGKFGFPVPTFQGRLAQDNPKCNTWEEAFSRSMEQFFDAEEEAQGPDGEMAELRRGIKDKVNPRPLRPTKTGGRKITPCLVHGDL
ncbi:hypothetical protein BDW74DRAFT_141693 [Aspergillus multicolor]|uniref:uncharacterized protein n=1 Tax=Aspergillus multicolor TaxID=41759 RepID=UPI003CCC8FDA